MKTLLNGADVSMLPALERAGAVFRDDSGKPADALRVMADHGASVFRLRLFVNPSKDFNACWGAVQDLDEVRALAKRVKDVGAKTLLCLHYSDTWADPMHQTKPAAWRDLPFDALERAVEQYTHDVLATLASDGVTPAFVQIGNEIAPGMLWPDGRVGVVKDDSGQREEFGRLARLLGAGIRATRGVDPAIRITIHTHGGGQPGVPTWFFKRLAEHALDFDTIGLSFYPYGGEKVPVLKQCVDDLIATHAKDVWIVETGYPWFDASSLTKDKTDAGFAWPRTPEGQAAFLRDLLDTVRAAKDGRCLGVLWWYPEAIPTPGLHIYRGGSDALFDREGKPLPAMALLK
ncbi:MAG: glycosyl hydrolase 53 family protein [Tepidisphaeraceae bacterium]